MSCLRQTLLVARKRQTVIDYKVDVHPLKGRRKGALIKEEVWCEDGEVSAYNLAYINLRICPQDNGRVLGFDNGHGFHHRHLMGKVESVEFRSYRDIFKRFLREMHDLRREEDKTPEN